MGRECSNPLHELSALILLGLGSVVIEPRRIQDDGLDRTRMVMGVQRRVEPARRMADKNNAPGTPRAKHANGLADLLVANAKIPNVIAIARIAQCTTAAAQV